MDNQESLKKKTLELYLNVVKKRSENHDILEKKRALFDRNESRIESHLKNNIETNQKNKEKLITFIKSKHEALDETYNQKKADFSHAKKLLEETLKQEIKTIEETLENKKHLNTLKQEKLETDYDYKIKSLHENTLKKEATLENSIDEVNNKFNTQQTTLNEELDDHLANLEAALEKDNTVYTQNHESIKHKMAEKIKATQSKLDEYKVKFKEAIEALDASYKEAVKPITEEIAELEAVRDKEIRKLNREFETLINKKKKYKKEAEKINEHGKASALGKEIKQLQKDHDVALSDKKAEHKVQLEPAYKTKQDLDNDYQNKYFNLKQEGIKKITMFLNSLQVTKTEEMIETDEVNHTFNIARANYKQKKTSIRLDSKIQAINFTQAKDEALVELDYEKQSLSPHQDLKSLQAKFVLDEASNELDKAIKVAQLTYQKDLDTLKANHQLALAENAYHMNRLEALLIYGHENLDLSYVKTLTQKEATLEQMMSGHYYHHAKNYTALKTIQVEQHQSSIHTEIDTRLKENIKHYTSMIEQAQSDHELMINKIETTYHNELGPYQQAFDELALVREEALKTLKEKHEETIKTLKETIKQETDKQQKRVHQKTLETATEKYKETLDNFQKETEEALNPYRAIIKRIKQFRIQSIEEAETLLNHISDQLTHMIDEAKALAQKEKDTYEDVYYKIKHSADLFQTFQLQRKEDTVTASENYLTQQHALIHRKEKALESKLTKVLNQFDKVFAKEKRETSEYLEALEVNYQKDMDQLLQAQLSTYESLKADYEEDKRRTESYLAKLKRVADQNLKKISKDAEDEKTTCFNEKSDSEEALEKEISRLNQALEDEKKKKEARKKAIVDEYQKHVDKMIDRLKEDAKDRLTVQTVDDLEAYIMGNISIESL